MPALATIVLAGIFEAGFEKIYNSCAFEIEKINSNELTIKKRNILLEKKEVAQTSPII